MGFTDRTLADAGLEIRACLAESEKHRASAADYKQLQLGEELSAQQLKVRALQAAHIAATAISSSGIDPIGELGFWAETLCEDEEQPKKIVELAENETSRLTMYTPSAERGDVVVIGTIGAGSVRVRDESEFPSLLIDPGEGESMFYLSATSAKGWDRLSAKKPFEADFSEVNITEDAATFMNKGEVDSKTARSILVGGKAVRIAFETMYGQEAQTLKCATDIRKFDKHQAIEYYLALKNGEDDEGIRANKVSVTMHARVRSKVQNLLFEMDNQDDKETYNRADDNFWQTPEFVALLEPEIMAGFVNEFLYSALTDMSVRFKDEVLGSREGLSYVLALVKRSCGSALTEKITQVLSEVCGPNKDALEKTMKQVDDRRIARIEHEYATLAVAEYERTHGWFDRWKTRKIRQNISDNLSVKLAERFQD